MDNRYENYYHAQEEQRQRQPLSYQQDPALVEIAKRFIQDNQAMGRSSTQIKRTLERSRLLMSGAQRSPPSASGISKVLQVLFGIILTLGILMLLKAFFTKFEPFAKPIPRINGVNGTQILQLEKLLQMKNVSIRDFEVGYLDSPIDTRDIAKIKAVLESAYQFIVVAQTENQNSKMVFGAYINRKYLEKSFIFSLNNNAILPVDRPQMAWEINPRNDDGPRFGKSDLQFFVFKEGGFDSMSNLCFNYICPQKIEYGTLEANQYLAGSEVFSTQSFTVLIRNVHSDL